MVRFFALLLLFAPPNDLTVKAPNLSFRTSPRVSGAIDSVKFRGREFVNSYDHGREWQSAVSYDGFGDCLYATEAGASKDGAGPDTSSQLLDARLQDATLETTSRMAYWLAPGESYKAACGEHPEIHAAQNQEVLSADTLLKQVTAGYRDLPNVIDYLVTLNTGEPHNSATVEAVAGYMPPEFSLVLTFDPATSQIAPLAAGSGEQPLPVIASTKDRQFAVGVYSPNASYGWKPSRWSCIFHAAPVRPGPVTYRCLLALGTVEEVRLTLQKLTSGQ